MVSVRCSITVTHKVTHPVFLTEYVGDVALNSFHRKGLVLTALDQSLRIPDKNLSTETLSYWLKWLHREDACTV